MKAMNANTTQCHLHSCPFVQVLCVRMLLCCRGVDLVNDVLLYQCSGLTPEPEALLPPPSIAAAPGSELGSADLRAATQRRQSRQPSTCLRGRLQ
jgi:hypothetical protein